MSTCPLCQQPIDEAAIDKRLAEAMKPSKPADEPRIGRPIKPPVEGERATLSMMVTPSTKERLDEAARRNGRTRSQEAEARIDWSFDRTDLLSEVLRLAYGEEIGTVLTLVGDIMSAAYSRDADAQRALIDGTAALLAVTLKARKGDTLADVLQKLVRSKDAGEDLRRSFKAWQDATGRLKPVQRLDRPAKRRAAT